MSEFDQGSGRKGFVRDVIRRIAPADEQGGDTPEDERERRPVHPLQDEVEDLHDSMRLFGAESPEFRRQLDRLLAEFETLRRRYQLTRDQSADAERQNERLVNALHDAKQQIELLKEEVDKLCAPPNNYGIFNRPNKDSSRKGNSSF
jgi:predicted RNase H-like nuclease (RuvC/YqgF family)